MYVPGFSEHRFLSKSLHYDLHYDSHICSRPAPIKIMSFIINSLHGIQPEEAPRRQPDIE